jgi:tRNA U34 5-methylaminomethyl-2-thiouridine-forming methyltransferase MnmC
VNNSDRKSIDVVGEPLKILFTDDGSQTLVSTSFGETYNSGSGAVTESAVVFVRNSGFVRRLAASQNPISILEVGFGTGLNLLTTLFALIRSRRFSSVNAVSEETSYEEDRPLLRYVGLDNYWPPAAVLEQLEYAASLRQIASNGLMLTDDPDLLTSKDTRFDCRLEEIVASYLSFRKTWSGATETSATETSSSISMADPRVRRFTSREVNFDAIDCDAMEWISRQGKSPPDQDLRFDIIYFDAFSPAFQPKIWTPGVFASLWQLLVSGGVLVSYCVQRSVKDALLEAGFQIEIVPGPIGGKRDVLVASRP